MIKVDQFLIKRSIKVDQKSQLKDPNYWLKDWKKWIKRSKESVKRSKLSIKRLKLSINIEKVHLFWLFQSFLIYFDLLLIYVEQFWTFQLSLKPFNWFGHDELKSGFKFGSEKLNKCWFDHDIKQNLALDRLHHRSLPLTDC